MKKIAVIEDNEDIRILLVEILTCQGFECVVAPNGYIGIQKIIEHEPDLVLCDIMMPELDGYEVLQAIRKSATVGNIPFIFLTAKIEPSDFREAMNLGADDYLTKPIDADLLIEVINNRLARLDSLKIEIKNEIQKIKDNLSSVYSHEINTPLNGILGLSEVLMKYYSTTIPENALEMIGHIKEASLRLHRTTNNLILFADLQRYTPQQYTAKFGNHRLDNPVELIMDIAQEIAERYKRQNDLVLEVKNEDIKIYEFDFTKIMNEAIDNAFKYSKSGSIVKIRSTIEDSFYKITVEDNGFGFDKSFIESIDSFVQFERGKYEQQGLGLGLFFIKRLVSLNNGKFEIETEKKIGTKLFIYLPKI
jgi:signal transduction histidine kinase